MAGRRIKEISGRGFNEKELDDDSQMWSCTFIYDFDKLMEWGEKCLEALEEAKSLPKENNVRLHEYDPVSVTDFQCITYGWNYKWKNYDDASFVSTLWYYQLIDIFGLNSNQELDITYPTLEQELEVCKAIMKDLWEEYKDHVL